MFVCDFCIENYVLNRPRKYIAKSYGSCEDCRKVGRCYDVPHNSYFHKNSPHAIDLLMKDPSKLSPEEKREKEALKKLLREFTQFTTDFNPSKREK